ncbi:MAG: hypothetical protein IT223_00035 [Crocinitomicaceae bacterium]|nr:hypothetical protein [Crocinitomicaceae bacterium]
MKTIIVGTINRNKKNPELTAEKDQSVEKMQREIQELEQKNRKLEEELAAREEIMMSLFSFIEGNRIK